MVLSLRHEVQQYIDQQVKNGRFPTPEAFVEAAIAEFNDSATGVVLTDADIAAISKAQAQADRGDGLELDEYRDQISKRFINR